MKSNSYFCFFFFVTVFIVGIGFPSLSQSAEGNPAKGEAKTTVVEEQKTTLIQIYSWATILPKELIDLQNSLTQEKNIKGVEEELAGLAKEAERAQKGCSHCPKGSRSATYAGDELSDQGLQD